MAKKDTYAIRQQGQVVTVELGYDASDWAAIVTVLGHPGESGTLPLSEGAAETIWSWAFERARLQKIATAEHEARTLAHQNNRPRKPKKDEA